MKDYFIDLGARNIEFAELGESLEILNKKIASSDLIYLPGGDQKILLERLKKIYSSFKKYNKIIVGNSAGALVLCKKFIYFEEYEKLKKMKLIPALNIVNFMIIAHYKSSNPKFSWRTKKFVVNLSKKENSKIYAIPEKSALVYDTKSKKVRFIGKICLFFKGKEIK